LQGKIFFSSSKRPDSLLGPPGLLPNGYHGSLPLVKRPGREFDHSPPSSVEVKNEWSYTSTPPICLIYVDRDSFTVALFFTFTGPCIVNIFQHNQQDAKLHNYIYFYKRSTCFRRFLRPSSGAQNCIHSIGYLSSFFCFLPPS
jgi:hypothetical protein